VVSEVEGTSQLVAADQGVVGVAPGNPEALADAIIPVVASPDNGVELGVKAFHYMKARANADEVFQEVIHDYRELLKQS
jgi:hypothetical protein